MQTRARAPALFVSASNGDTQQAAALRRVGRSLGTPQAIVVVSSVWSAEPPRVTSARQPPSLPAEAYGDELAGVSYPCPGSPCLAGRIAHLTSAVTDPGRGLDPGAWIPVRHMFPDAGVPVVQLSLPARASPEAPVVLGRQLAPLREEGVVLVGSGGPGGIVQNPRRVQRHGTEPPEWARAFDRWVAERFHALDLSSLMDFRREAPHAHLAAPTADHLRPLLVVLGAALPGDRAEDLFDGFEHGTVSLRCFALRS